MSDRHRKPARRIRVEPNIYKRADGTFEVGYRDSTGKQRWKTLPPRVGIKAARAVRDDILARRGRGERVRPSPKLTFGDAADKWWAAQAVKLRPATQSAYRASLKRVRAAWGRTRLDDITVGMVAAFVSDMERLGYRGWTIKGQLTVTSRVFSYAIRHLGWLGSSPVAQLDKGERPRSDQRDKRVLTSDELARLLAAVDDRYRLLFGFAAATGARLGEVLGLRWHGVDLKAGTVHFSHQLGRAGDYSELKTARSRRTIELPRTLVAALKAHKLASPYSGDHDFVFANRDGRGHDHRNIGGRVLARAVERAGVGAEERDGQLVLPAPTFHSLRHTHGSALIAAGWDIEEVSARLGHKDSGVTVKAYIHAYESAQRSEARSERLESMYGAPLTAAQDRDSHVEEM